jgi:predicted Fe-Mo cluster-binding NifX family protein
MKVAITSTGNTTDSKLDQRFGRCSYFVIYDQETKGIEFIPNPGKMHRWSRLQQFSCCIAKFQKLYPNSNKDQIIA